MKLIAFYFSCIILNGCINLSKCDSNVIGKYYCYNHNDAINYIEFHENGDFEHVFEKGKYRLIDKGKWELSKNGYCQILLNNWKNFNEKGENYEELGNGILFINDNSLDMTPDGPSSTSFEK